MNRENVWCFLRSSCEGLIIKLIKNIAWRLPSMKKRSRTYGRCCSNCTSALFSLWWGGSRSGSSSSKGCDPATAGLQSLEVFILGHDSFVCVHGHPWLYFEPLQPLNFYLDTYPDPSSQNNADSLISGSATLCQLSCCHALARVSN